MPLSNNATTFTHLGKTTAPSKSSQARNMSGIEVVGIVLGALPLAISLFQSYEPFPFPSIFYHGAILMRPHEAYACAVFMPARSGLGT